MKNILGFLFSFLLATQVALANSAYDYNGSNDDTSNSTASDIHTTGDDISGCAWTNADSHSYTGYDQDTIIRHSGSNGAHLYTQFVLEYNNTNNCDSSTGRDIYFMGNTVDNPTTAVFLSCSSHSARIGNWHHICGANQFSDRQIIVDGVVEGETVADFTKVDASARTSFGGRQDSNLDVFDGKQAHHMIWYTHITTEDASNIMHNPMAVSVRTDAPAVWLPGYLSSQVDSSGNAISISNNGASSATGGPPIFMGGGGTI